MENKTKIIPCPICHGIGSHIKEISRKKTPSKEIIVISKLSHCDYCNEWGQIKVDNLTYYIKHNTIKNKLYNLYNDKDEEGIVYTTCCECEGTGTIESDHISPVDSPYIIEIFKQCEECKGYGEVVDEEKTAKVKKRLIEDYSEKLDTLKSNNKGISIYGGKYKDCSVKRTDVKYIIDYKHNICLNCVNYKKNKWGIESVNPYCEECCHYNEENSKTLFKGIGKKSEMWYNKNVNPTTKINSNT